MIDPRELRIGNLVSYYYPTKRKPIVEAIQGIFFEDTVYNEYVVTFKKHAPVSITGLMAIPLTEEWLVKLPKNLAIPHWVKYVHEVQNWYYWNNNKIELF